MTSIEWLIEQLDIITRDTNKYDDFKWIFEHEIEQAKEMHKKEIIDAHASGYDCSGENGEDYYNAIYDKTNG
jgi:predicted Ser/Thr protein kinase